MEAMEGVSAALTIWAASFNIVVGLLHLPFPRFFRWSDELPRLGRVNRSLVKVMNLCIAAILVLLGGLLLVTESPTGLLAILMVFWVFRATLQPLYFGTGGVTNRLVILALVMGSVLHAIALASGALRVTTAY